MHIAGACLKDKDKREIDPESLLDIYRNGFLNIWNHVYKMVYIVGRAIEI